MTITPVYAIWALIVWGADCSHSCLLEWELGELSISQEGCSHLTELGPEWFWVEHKQFLDLLENISAHGSKSNKTWFQRSSVLLKIRPSDSKEQFKNDVRAEIFSDFKSTIFSNQIRFFKSCFTLLLYLTRLMILSQFTILVIIILFSSLQVLLLVCRKLGTCIYLLLMRSLLRKCIDF